MSLLVLLADLPLLGGQVAQPDIFVLPHGRFAQDCYCLNSLSRTGSFETVFIRLFASFCDNAKLLIHI